MQTANKAQQNYIDSVSNGEISLPENSESLVSMLDVFSKLYDYDALESDWRVKCDICYLSRLTTIGDELGYGYRSSVVQVLTKRKYFANLKKSMLNRGLNATSEIELSLIKSGYINRAGAKARVTTMGAKYLESVKGIENTY